MTPVVEVSELCFGYGAQPVLAGISFRIFPGEAVGIMGANGSGKSTLLWCIAGLLRGAGTVHLFGERPGKAGRGRMGMVFQNPEDQLFMPALAEDLALPLRNTGLPAAQAREIALDRLREFGLERKAEEPATHLSLGQRKRAAIALAMVRKPDLLILDEPTAELDGRSVRQLAATLGGIGVTRLIASHHLEFLRATSSRVLVLCNGRLITDGPAASVLADAELLARAGLV